MLAGGVYNPVLLIVPLVDDPPTTPSTDQVTLPLAVNCCVMLKVNTAERGVTPKPVPVPDKEIICGLPGELSLIATEAPRVPVSVGVKITLIVQAPFGARVDPQLFVSEKSLVLPLTIVIELIVNTADPVFDNVTGCGLLLTPVETLPKLMLLLLRLATGVVVPAGVLKATICMIHCPELRFAVAL